MFENDLAISKAAIPFQDEIYKNILPVKKIIRFSKDEERFILDKNYHIDVELELQNGIKLMGQEKALRQQFAHFDTFTIEFYQNRFTKERGEFFNLAVQFYSHGYVDANVGAEITGFIKFYMIKIFDFLEALKSVPIAELEKQTKPSTSNANFYYIKYNDIPQEFIYYSQRV
jgi:hypothetical protein